MGAVGRRAKEERMNRKLIHALALVGVAASASAMASITFYEGEGFRGRAVTIDQPVGNLERYGFNDRAMSIIVDRGRWEVCEDAGFGGKCVVLRNGNYDSLREFGLRHR